MNWDQVHGNWKQMSGLLRKKWAKLTGDDMNDAKGDRAILAGKLQEHYGSPRKMRNANSMIWSPSIRTRVATEGAPVDTATLKIGMRN